MDYMQSITSLISSTGFPIVMTLLLWKYISNEQKETREVLNGLKETITLLTEAVKGKERSD